MSDIKTTLISGLTTTTTIADTDNLIVGGSDAKKITWATILSLIKSKLGIGSYSSLTTTSKELVGAVNELNSKMAFEPLITLVDNVKYSKNNVLGFASITGNLGLEAKSWHTLGTLPKGYYPITNCYFLVPTNGGITMFGIVNIAPSGEIRIYSNNDIGSVLFTALYPISTAL